MLGLLLLGRRVFFDRYFSKLSGRLMKMTRGLFSSKNPLSNSMIGLANGFLPCGLVYMGLVGALATGDLSSGALYMFLFGLGTIPIMLGLSMTGKYISTNFRVLINKLIPIFLICDCHSVYFAWNESRYSICKP